MPSSSCRLPRRLPSAAHLVLFLLAGLTGPACAETVDNALSKAAELDASARASQTRIDAVDADREAMLSRYLNLVREAEALRPHVSELERLTAAQRDTLASLDSQIATLDETARGIAPMFRDMLDTLERFVARDLPYLTTEREARLASLARTLDDPESPPAHKLRRLIEAYQVELEYGRTIEAYGDTIEIDGKATVVDLLRIGRLMLFYRLPDGAGAGIFDAEAGRFRPGDAELERQVARGLKVAANRVAPMLLALPVPTRVVTDPGAETP